MPTNTLRRAIWLAAVGLGLMGAGLLSGCGGGETAGYDISPNDGYPKTIYFTPVLKVTDEYDNPLGGATVWVEDEAESRTSSRYVALGEGYPDSWVGRKANWIGPIYDVILRNPDASKRVHVTVTAPGYDSDDTYFDIDAGDPNRLFGYDTLQLTSTSSLMSKPAAAKVHHPETAGGPPLKPGTQTKPLPTK